MANPKQKGKEKQWEKAGKSRALFRAQVGEVT